MNQLSIPEIYENYSKWCESLCIKPASIEIYCETNYADSWEQEKVLEGGL